MRHFGLALGCVLVLLAPGVGAADPTAAPTPEAGQPATTLQALIDRYIAWRGGAAYEALQTVREGGYLDAPSGRQTASFWMDRQGRTRTEVDLGGFTQVSIASAHGAWSVSPSGQVLDEPDAAQAARRYAQVSFGDALMGRGGAQVKLGKTAQVNGKPFPIVDVSFGDADSYDLILDPVTGALCCYGITEKGVTRLEVFHDWRLVDGVRMPFAQQTQGDQNSATQFSDIKLNQPFDAALFDKPAAKRLAAFDAGGAWSGWIDFELYAETQVFLPVKVNGRDAAAWLDSGATTSLLNKSFAAAAGLAAKGNVPIAGTTSTTSTSFVQGVNIEAGRMRLGPLTAPAFDLASVEALDSHAVPVILGDEPFNELIVDIDYAHHRVAFRDPAGFTPPPGALQLPLDHGGIPVSIEGRAPVRLIFDLGDGGEIDLYPAYAQAQNLLAGRKVSQSLAGDITGLNPETVAILRDIEIGGVKLADVPVSFPANRPPNSNSDVAGRIGAGVLSRFRLLVDYPQNRLYLVPEADTVARPFTRNRLGLVTVAGTGGLDVKLVAPGSPAEAAGLKAGDRVVQIDGEPAAAWTYARMMGLVSGPPGTNVRITLEGGAEKTVTLADYF